MNPPLRSRIAEALARHERIHYPALQGRTNHLDAGVLVPIVEGREVGVVVTERSSRLRSHPGEICFPGGRPDAGDGDLLTTALREAGEEVGVGSAEVDVVGELSSVPLYTSDYRLHPYVAIVAEGCAPTITSPAEVEKIHVLSLEALLARESIHGIPWSSHGKPAMSPIFEVGDRFLFGGTAAVLYELLVVMAPVLGQRLPPLVPGR